MEMRRDLRYRLEIPALFCWQNAHHRRLYSEGITRDISVLGAFIVSSTCPPVDSHVEVEVVLSPFGGMKSTVRIKGEARVIRIEHGSGDYRVNGFAVFREASNQWTLAHDRGEIEGIQAEPLRIKEKTVLH